MSNEREERLGVTSAHMHPHNDTNQNMSNRRVDGSGNRRRSSFSGVMSKFGLKHKQSKVQHQETSQNDSSDNTNVEVKETLLKPSSSNNDNIGIKSGPEQKFAGNDTYLTSDVGNVTSGSSENVIDKSKSQAENLVGVLNDNLPSKRSEMENNVFEGSRKITDDMDKEDVPKSPKKPEKSQFREENENPTVLKNSSSKQAVSASDSYLNTDNTTNLEKDSELVNRKRRNSIPPDTTYTSMMAEHDHGVNKQNNGKETSRGISSQAGNYSSMLDHSTVTYSDSDRKTKKESSYTTVNSRNDGRNVSVRGGSNTNIYRQPQGGRLPGYHFDEKLSIPRSSQKGEEQQAASHTTFRRRLSDTIKSAFHHKQ